MSRRKLTSWSASSADDRFHCRAHVIWKGRDQGIPGSMKQIGQMHQSLKDIVAAEIRKEILAGNYKPGERLIEQDLGEKYGVSRMPVRQALAELEVEGFVQNIPRKGASVISLTVEESLELFEVRGALEGMAARLAAQNASDEDLARLSEIIERGRSAVGTEKADEMPRLHEDFHLTLGRAAGNSYLMELLAPLPARIEWIHATEIRERANLSWPEHAEIVEAVRSRDPDLAEQLTRRHVSSAAKDFVSILAERGHSEGVSRAQG